MTCTCRRVAYKNTSLQGTTQQMNQLAVHISLTPNKKQSIAITECLGPVSILYHIRRGSYLILRGQVGQKLTPFLRWPAHLSSRHAEHRGTNREVFKSRWPTLNNSLLLGLPKQRRPNDIGTGEHGNEGLINLVSPSWCV